MRKLALTLCLPFAATLLGGCSGDKQPDVTKNPVWGPQVQALREAEDVAKFAEEHQQLNDQALKNLGLAPEQIKQGR